MNRLFTKKDVLQCSFCGHIFAFKGVGVKSEVYRGHLNWCVEIIEHIEGERIGSWTKIQKELAK